MTDDIIALARRHKHIASHYEGCEADHIGCLVNKLADEVEGLRAENEALHAALKRRDAELLVERMSPSEKMAILDRLEAQERRRRAELEGKP